MIFELVQDFGAVLDAMPLEHPRRRILKLLDEAIRRDVHFIDRHPTTLFQCLWNSCWWYDCPEAAKHYVVREGGWPPGPPWAWSGPRLSKLVETWRTEKQRHIPGFLWIRSLRPGDVPLGTKLKRLIRTERWDLTTVVLSFNGQHILALAPREAIEVWDAQTGSLLSQVSAKTLRCMCHSPIHDLIACGSDHGEVHIKDVLNRGDVVWLRTNDEQPIWTVDWSANGDLIAVGCADGKIHVWDFGSRTEIMSGPAHKEEVRAVAISANGRYVASGAWDETVRVWDLEQGRFIATLSTPNYSITCLAFSPDGSQLVVGTRFSSLIDYHLNKQLCDSLVFALVLLWDLQSQEQPRVLFQEMESSDQGVVSVAFSPDGQRIAVALGSSTIRILRVDDGTEIDCLIGHSGAVTSVVFDRAGDSVVSGSNDHSIRLWHLAQEYLARSRLGHQKNVRSVALSQDGTMAASAAWDGSIWIWNTKTGAASPCVSGHADAVGAVALSREGQMVATGSRDRTVRVWESNTGQQKQCLEGHQEEVNSVAFSPCGNFLVSGSADSIRIWNVHDGLENGCIPLRGDWLLNAEFSLDGEQIIAWFGSQIVAVWNRWSLEFIEGHQGPKEFWLAGSVNFSYKASGKYHVDQDGPHGSALQEPGHEPLVWVAQDIFSVKSNSGTSVFIGTSNVAKDFCMFRLETGNGDSKE